jgi:hypothetical protein
MVASLSSTAAETDGGGAVGALDSTTTVDSSSSCGGVRSVLEGCGRVSEETTRALNARRFRGPRLSTPVSACLPKDEYQHKQTSRKNNGKQEQKSETYILERTRAFFTGRSDIPCWGAVRFEPVDSGAARFEPVVSGAAPLPPAASTAVALLVENRLLWERCFG